MHGKKSGLESLKLQGPELGQTVWRLGEIRFDERARELTVAGKPMPLEPLPASLFMVLLRHPNALVLKDELFRMVWAGRVVTESVLTKGVAKLRAALGDSAAGLIQTVHGLGYRLNGLPQALDSQPATPPIWRKGLPIPDRAGWRLQQPVQRPQLPGDWWLAQHEDGSQWLLCAAEDPDTLESLRRELALLRAVSHKQGSEPVLEPITDCNLGSHRGYLAWHADAGCDLATWLETHHGLAALPPAARLALALALCRAVMHWHDAGGSSDGGLRPWHFLLRMEGNHPVITLSHLGRRPPRDEYTPPECTAGKTLRSPRGDLYSLGLLLYKLLAGNLEARQSPGWEALLDDPLLAEDLTLATQLSPEKRLASVHALHERLLQLESRHKARADLEATRRALGAEQARSKRWRQALFWSVLVATMVCGALGGTLYAGQTAQAKSLTGISNLKVQ